MWLRGPLSVLDSTSVGSLSCQLSAFGKLTTTDFERKCRGLQEFDRWKATEFRFFSHYAGPLTLKKHTSQPFTNTSFFSMLALPFLYRRQWWAWQTMQSSYSFFCKRVFCHLQKDVARLQCVFPDTPRELLSTLGAP